MTTFVSGSRVELVEALAHDYHPIRAAKVSFANDEILPPPDFPRTSDAGLLRYLMANRHGSPFEHGMFTFRVETTIAVVREWQRHRAGHSYNEQSGRYSKLTPIFYVPALDNVRTQVGKPGAYTYRPLGGLRARLARRTLITSYKAAWVAYEALLRQGVAREQARLVLPLGLITRFYWTCNPRSLMHFLSLRNAPDAMQEIRACAEVVEGVFRAHMPITAAAFVANGRTSP